MNRETRPFTQALLVFLLWGARLRTAFRPEMILARIELPATVMQRSGSGRLDAKPLGEGGEPNMLMNAFYSIGGA